MIDNVLGFGAGLSAGDSADAKIVIQDNKIYGESELLDCPGDGSFCNDYSKVGFIYSGVSSGGKGLHVLPGKATPIHKTITSGTWSGRMIFDNNEFIGFKYETRYGKS